VVASLVLGLGGFVAFALWEWKCPTVPLLPRESLFRIIWYRAKYLSLVYIFKKPIVIAAAITQFVNGFLSIVQVFYLPTFYQLAYGYSPVKSGLLLLPITVVQSE
jgi:hypothetical protein